MAIINGTGYCPYCEKQVLIQKKGTSHILHLFLSLITCGCGFLFGLSAELITHFSESGVAPTAG